jgi:hypothetical protein
MDNSQTGAALRLMEQHGAVDLKLQGKNKIYKAFQNA